MKKMKVNMSFILVKKISLLFLLITAPLFATSFAGRVHKSMVSKEVSTTHEEKGRWEDAESSMVRNERVLKVKTNDYGSYDPTPALVKPPFKLIPN